jgi:hypothetical protein
MPRAAHSLESCGIERSRLYQALHNFGTGHHRFVKLRLLRLSRSQFVQAAPFGTLRSIEAAKMKTEAITAASFHINALPGLRDQQTTGRRFSSIPCRRRRPLRRRLPASRDRLSTTRQVVCSWRGLTAFSSHAQNWSGSERLGTRVTD